MLRIQLEIIMKVLCKEVQDEGLISLLGQRVTFWCVDFIWTGKLVGVNDDCVKLEDCGIVFETGDFNNKTWARYEKLPKEFYLMKAGIVGFGLVK